MKNKRKTSISNWSKIMIACLVLLLLLLNPFTRGLIMLILPLGSGVDDLIFLVVFFVAVVLLLIRILPVKNPIQKIAKWFLK